MNTLRLASAADVDALAVLRAAASPGTGFDEARAGAARALSPTGLRVVFLVWREGARPGDPPDGFVDVERATGVPGAGGPSGALMGLYVAPPVRRHGLGRALLDAAARWAGAQGCASLVVVLPAGAPPVPALDALGLDPGAAFVVRARPIDRTQIPLSLPGSGHRARSATVARDRAGAPRPAWPRHAVVAGLGAWALASANVWSPDPWHGALAPLVAAGAFMYFVAVFVARRYARDARAGDRAGELFRIDAPDAARAERRER